MRKFSICIGNAITDDNWTVSCPKCSFHSEWRGFFDPEDVYDCPNCGAKFKVGKIVFENGDFIK